MASAQDILKKFKQLKTLPHIAIKLSQLISDENTSVKDLEEVIRLDPTLIVRLLKLVNSPYFGLREKVKDIAEAVVFIGMKNLRNMVVVNALKEIFKQAKDDELFSRSQLWFHCAVSSICCQMLSERVFRKKGEDAFLCGILHDIGMIVLDQVETDLYKEVYTQFRAAPKLIVEYEKEIIGADHSRIGYLLARDWKLPVVVQEGIKNHHKTIESISPSSISGVIQLTEYLTDKLKYHVMPGMKVILSQELLNHIKNNVAEYKQLMTDLPVEISKAMQMYQLDK